MSCLHFFFSWYVYFFFSPRLPHPHNTVGGSRSLLSVSPQLAAHHAAVLKAGGSPALRPAHCALEAVVVVEAAPLAEATVKREFWMDSAEVEEAWRLAAGAEFPVEAAAAETKLTGLLVSRERFWGFRNRGAVTMFGAPPALANTRFPVASSDVIGREPLEARAIDKDPRTERTLNFILEKPLTHQQSSTQQQRVDPFTGYIVTSNATLQTSTQVYL